MRSAPDWCASSPLQSQCLPISIRTTRPHFVAVTRRGQASVSATTRMTASMMEGTWCAAGQGGGSLPAALGSACCASRRRGSLAGLAPGQQGGLASSS